MNIRTILCTALVAMMFVGCGGGSPKSEFSTDLINNPNTANGDSKKVSAPAITFDKKMHDFGRLSQGESIAYSFKFTNDYLIAKVTKKTAFSTEILNYRMQGITKRDLYAVCRLQYIIFVRNMLLCQCY